MPIPQPLAFANQKLSFSDMQSETKWCSKGLSDYSMLRDAIHEPHKVSACHSSLTNPPCSIRNPKPRVRLCRHHLPGEITEAI